MADSEQLLSKEIETREHRKEMARTESVHLFISYEESFSHIQMCIHEISKDMDEDEPNIQIMTLSARISKNTLTEF